MSVSPKPPSAEAREVAAAIVYLIRSTTDDDLYSGGEEWAVAHALDALLAAPSSSSVSPPASPTTERPE